MTSLQKIFVALPLALLAACSAPSVPQSPPPAPTSAAVFDPTTNAIPLPNDIALLSIPPTLPPAQQELLRAFQAQGGFPNDQEVPITIQFQTSTSAPDGTVTTTAPDLDFTSINQGTLVAVLQTAQGIGPATLDPIQPTDYVKTGTVGTLTLHNKGRLPWTPGHYIVAMRGGSSGVKTTGGAGIVASPVFFLIAQGQPLNTEAGISLLRAQTGSTEAAQAAAAQLQPIIDAYKNGPFQVVDQVFPHQEAATLTTFAIAPIAGTQVQLDAGRGIVPLPIDLLRDPRPASASCAACGKLTPLAACTFAQGKLDAQGNCSSSAAAGFQALDGFSTTGFILAQTSDLVTASTVNPTNVKLFDLSNPGAPALVDPSTYITEPVEVTQSGFSTVIALQPAGATAGDPTSVFRTRPLKDNTDYAVVITSGVQDKTGKGLVPGTVARILQFANRVADANGKSQLTGIDDATASGLEAMRGKLASVLGSGQVDRSRVAMAFTFHTQTILSTAVQLGALPYSTPAPTAATTATVATSTPAAAFAKYGVDPGLVPNGNINEILETTITTFRLLDDTTGAFNPNPAAAAPETIHVMVATPLSTAPTLVNCALPAPLNGLKCSPLAIFRHGLGRGRLDMLNVADKFASLGFTVVAIDAEKHGDRSFCTSGQPTITAGGVTVPQCATAVCASALPPGAQGDALPPGKCPGANATPPTNDFVRQPVSPTCRTNPAGCPGFVLGAAGIPVVSSNYLVTANFFRTRDSLRQDFIDQSQLVRAITTISGPGADNGIFDHMSAQGVIIDPTKVNFVGQSLGAIQGTPDVATNPRISNAVFNVGGGTVVDVFTNSPAFVQSTNALLASIGVTPGPNPGFLQFLVVSKMILDPADPVNFASHLTANTLPNLLADPTGRTPQAAKKVLTQAAFCDQVVPNPFNFILDATMGTGPLLIDPGFGAGGGTFQLFFQGAPSPAAFAACPSPPQSGVGTPGAVEHGFLTDWVNPVTTDKAQREAATFLSNPTPRASLPLQGP